MEIRTLNSIDQRTIDKRFLLPIPGFKIVLCTDRDFEKRVVALYIFAWLVFATFPLSLSLIQAKGFLKILKHTPHWHKTKICKSVEKNFYLFFIQSLTDMTQMFNMIYR